MAKTKQETTFLEEDIDLQESYGKVENFINENKGLVIGIVGGLTLLIVGFFGFNNIYLPSQEKEAQAQMFVAQKSFESEQYQEALDGKDGYPGFLEIIDSYGSLTKANELAHYYAGISYLNLKKFDEAIQYLSNFSSDDRVVNAMALGAMGDAYMELGQKDNGLKYYKKAANYSNNELTSAMFLMKAGAATELAGNLEEAKSLYTQIKSKYPESQQARDIDKYIARVEKK